MCFIVLVGLVICYKYIIKLKYEQMIMIPFTIYLSVYLGIFCLETNIRIWKMIDLCYFFWLASTR